MVYNLSSLLMIQCCFLYLHYRDIIHLLTCLPSKQDSVYCKIKYLKEYLMNYLQNHNLEKKFDLVKKILSLIWLRQNHILKLLICLTSIILPFVKKFEQLEDLEHQQHKNICQRLIYFYLGHHQLLYFVLQLLAHS